jgi:hypothetical protein
MGAMYDEQLLLDFANGFFGYGALNPKLWLIGPEAGGGNTLDELCKRASVWSRRGRKHTDDLHEYHSELGFDFARKTQQTWGPLIKVLLAVMGRSIDPKSVLEFQKDLLGRANGDNCVLDVSQLASPTESDWKAAAFGFAWTRDREVYDSIVGEPRRELLREWLIKWQPRLVLFYGSHYPWWERISSCGLSPSRLPGLSLASNAHTLFAAMPQPVNINRTLELRGKGAVNEYLREMGELLREELQVRHSGSYALLL